MPDYLFGVPITIAGVSILAAGHLGPLVSVQQASLLVTVAGLTLMLFGRRAFQLVWAPWLYLLMALPIWDPLLSRLRPPSQVLSGRDCRQPAPFDRSASGSGGHPDRIAESHPRRPGGMQRSQSAHGDRGDDLAGGISLARWSCPASDACRHCRGCRVREQRFSDRRRWFPRPSRVGRR